MKARVLKTIRSQINSLRNTLLPRQSGAVEGEAYSNAGESFQRSAGSIVQITEDGRVIEAPEIKVVEGIAKEVSDRRTAELEAILADGVGAENLSGYALGTMLTSNVSFALTPTISKATGFFLSGNSIICEKPGRYVFSVRCSLDGTITGSDQARCTFGLQRNGVTYQQVSANPILTTVRYLYKDCGTIVAVLDCFAGDAITFDATVIATTGFARVDLSVWCVSARKASAGGGTPITTKGDLIYGDASGEAERLPVGADGKVLKVVSGLPSWEDSSSLPPNVFFVGDEDELLTALACDGDRVVTLSKGFEFTTTNIPVGAGQCSVFGGEEQNIPLLGFPAGTTITGTGYRLKVYGGVYGNGTLSVSSQLLVRRLSGYMNYPLVVTSGVPVWVIDLGPNVSGDVFAGNWIGKQVGSQEIGTTELKAEVVDQLVPPNVFFVSTEAEFLTALAYDGDRVVNVTTSIVVAAETITVESGLCRITGLTSNAPNAVNLFSPTSQTTFAGPGVPLFECGVWCYNIHLDGISPYFTNILPMGNQVVTAEGGEKVFYERIPPLGTSGSLTGAVQQLYWKNTNDSSGGASVITTKGDLIVGDASGAEARLPIGANGQSLIVKDNTAKWGGLVIPTFNVSTQTELADAMRTATPNNIMHINVTAPITTNAGMSDYATPDKPIRRDCTYIFSGQRIKLGYGGWYQQGTGGPYNSKLIFLCELEYNHSGVSGGRPDTPRGKVWAKILYGEDSESDLNIKSDYPHKVQKFVQRSKNVTGEISQATFDLQYDPTNQSVQIKELESDSIYNGHLSNKAVTGAKIADNTVTPTQTYGASGSFTDPDGNTITVTNGLITAITPP